MAKKKATAAAKPAKPAAKKPRAPKAKKAVEAAPEASVVLENPHRVVGVRRNRLMELADSYGDTALLNPRSIDPLVYMLAEMAEASFGPQIIEACEEDIALSNAGARSAIGLQYMADLMLRKYLALEFLRNKKDEPAGKLRGLPPLDQRTYVDYFMMVSLMERDASRTTLSPVMGDMAKLLSGYQTGQPLQVCQTVVRFFEVTRNPKGMIEIMRGLSRLMKGITK